MTDRVVVGLMTGAAHCPYEIVKLRTIRHYWDGRIVVHFTEPRTESLMQKVADEFDVETVAVAEEPVSKRSNKQFVGKVAMFARGTFPGQTALYLDSDLIVRGSLAELFERAEERGACFTQFNTWRTGGNGLIAKRIRDWVKVVPEHEWIAEATIAGNHPSPNGGIVCGQPGHQNFIEWLDWCYRGMNCFINDETALQMLLPRWISDDTASIIEGGSYNCSPKHKPASLAWEDVHIIHGHGDSFLRPKKQGVPHWLPLFNQCLADNVGGCAEWDLMGLGNKWLRKNFDLVDGQLVLKDGIDG